MAMQKSRKSYYANGPGPEVIPMEESVVCAIPHDPNDIASKIIEAFSDEEELQETSKSLDRKS